MTSNTTPAIEARLSPGASIGQLQALLSESLQFAPSFDDGMSNHIPMALHAAWELGADEARLRALLAHESAKQEAAPPRIRDLPEETLQPGGWLRWRGQRAAYSELLRYFEMQLTQDGPAQVLRKHLPDLLPGLHAFAFHGLIRTGHAWELTQQGSEASELAAALATWASWFETLPAGRPPDDQHPALPMADWAEQLREGARGWRSELPMITWRMQAATQTPIYAALADRTLPVAGLAETRDAWMDLALQTYLHSRNFTVLHLITGLRALRVLSTLLPATLDPRQLQQLLARAACAGWLAGRVQWQASPALPAPQSLRWADLAHAALAQQDEHVIKLVHACWQEDQYRADPRWRQAAALACGYRSDH